MWKTTQQMRLVFISSGPSETIMEWSVKWDEMDDLTRGEFIRTHARGRNPVSPDALMELFGLSEAGLVLILQGQPWREEYIADPLAPRKAVAADFGLE
jgi:hypothetical protein